MHEHVCGLNISAHEFTRWFVVGPKVTTLSNLARVALIVRVMHTNVLDRLDSTGLEYYNVTGD